MTNKKNYYGDYLVGSETSWTNYCTDYGLDWNILKALPTTRRSVLQSGEEWYYLIELPTDTFSTDLLKLFQAKYRGLAVLKQHESIQLRKSFKDLLDSSKERIMDDDLNVLEGKEWAARNWAFTVEPDYTAQFWFDTSGEAETYFVNHKAALKNIFDIYETISS